MATPPDGGAERAVRIDCEGAPRDLGLDQARAIGEGVDAELARILGERPLDPGTRALGRDVERHFPHLAERMAGLARGATVERKALMVALARAVGEPGFLLRPARAAGYSAPLAPRALLAGRFDLSADRCSAPVIRRSEPQGGFPSLELTLPWLAASLGGVNAEGFAVLLGPPGRALAEDEPLRAEARCRAPALLFVQQCLERFDRVDTAVEWCLSRPSDGSASILFADARDGLAGVAFDADRRRVLAPGAAGWLWPADGAAAQPESGQAGLDAGGVSLPALLSAPDERLEDALAHRAYLWLDPSARALEVVFDRDGLSPDGLVERFALAETIRL